MAWELHDGLSQNLALLPEHGLGDFEPLPDGPQADKLKDEWQVAMLQIERATKGRGALAGNLHRLVEELRHPQTARRWGGCGGSRPDSP